MRIHISAPTRVDTSVLSRVLLGLGAEVVGAQDDRQAALSVADVYEADAVIAVLSDLDDRYQASVYFEAGLAVGRGVPVLFVTDREEPPKVPLTSLVQWVRANLANQSSLQFHIGLFLKRAAQPQRVVPEARTHGVEGETLERLRAELDRLRSHTFGAARAYALEAWVGDLLRLSGGEVVEPTEGVDRGFDFVADVPGSRLDGPVVVEVKTSASPRVLLSAANQLQSLVLQQSAALGLLVFDDGDLPPAFALQVVPMVISLGTNELLESLRESPLSQVLWDARRDAVHRL